MADYISTLTGQQMDAALLDMNNHTSEAWAVGKRNGTVVPSIDPTYKNNAKFYAEATGNMTATATTLAAGESATVTKTIVGDSFNLAFGIPRGGDASITSTLYGTSNSKDTVPTNWTSTIPTVTAGNFLWTKLTWADATTTIWCTRYGSGGGGGGDMYSEEYDPTTGGVATPVKTAGGIPAYVDEKINTHNSSLSAHSSLFSDKQDTLVSGTNIKTVNSNTLLGSGNLTISNGVITASNVSASTWVSDSTYEGFSYKCELTIQGCTSDHIPMITLGFTEARSGNYAPVALAETNKVTLYSKVNESITIPSIQLTKAV